MENAAKLRTLLLTVSLSCALLLLAYFASIGPVIMLADRGFVTAKSRAEIRQALNRTTRFYGPYVRPWMTVTSRSSALKRLTLAYVHLWRRITGVRNLWHGDIYEET